MSGETSPAGDATTKAGHTHAFQADVARLLHLMVHAIYSDRDIFLRELISNAADACEKLRYEAQSDPALVADGAPFAIEIALDDKARTLTVSDNGVGMSEADLVDSLGVIASSGTRAFLERMNHSRRERADREEDGGEARDGDLIGQFGIGFYSAFMVADRVDVVTRRAGESRAYRWSSDGRGEYAIAEMDIADAPAHGARVVLHLKDDAGDYLDRARVSRIVREHSGAVPVPVDLRDSGGAVERIGGGGALWTKPRSAISEHDYTEFYRDLARQFDEPDLTVHWRAEGRHEYTVLAFVPGSRPLDLFDPTRKGRARLYVRRVLISSDADILPGWLRFVRLLVDSADLPLNVSREMIQQTPAFAAIKKAIVNRLLTELGKLADNDKEKFARVWKNFGGVLKEGLYEDPERRDAIFKFARFASLKHPDETRTLGDYVADMRPNQNAIYYIAGDDAKRLAASPQLEGFRARDVDVLLFADPVDAFWVQTAVGFDGKPFRSVTQGAADIDSLPLKEGESEPPVNDDAAVASLIDMARRTLADVVEDVRPSRRLSHSASCLVASDKALDRRIEQLLAEHGRLEGLSKPVLELNPSHEIVRAIAGRDDEAAQRDAIWLLYEEARVLDGLPPSDPAAFVERLSRVLARAMA